MSDAPYAPSLYYACDDEECCENGCPQVTCRVCGRGWPCPDYVTAHTPSQVERQRRWVDRLWYGDDDGILDYLARKRRLGSDD